TASTQVLDSWVTSYWNVSCRCYLQAIEGGSLPGIHHSQKVSTSTNSWIRGFEPGHRSGRAETESFSLCTPRPQHAVGVCVSHQVVWEDSSQRERWWRGPLVEVRSRGARVRDRISEESAILRWLEA